jgi:hypothetical protein
MVADAIGCHSLRVLPSAAFNERVGYGLSRPACRGGSLGVRASLDSAKEQPDG